jgi:phosphate transport system substrate-binding protein
MKFFPALSKKIFLLIILLTVFSSCKNAKTDSPVIRLKGSESEMKLMNFLLEKYQQRHAGIKFSLEGGGSGPGIKALINGEIEIANASRGITDDEISQANANKISPVPVIIALDAVAIITHSRVGIDSLSITQLSKLFNGEIKNWKEIGGLDLPVVIFSRDENSGTHHYLKNYFHISNYAPGTHFFADYTGIVDAVSKQPGAIGYVNLGSIYDANEKPVSNVWVAGIYVEGSPAYSPYQVEYVKNGEYPLTRPLYQYVNISASGAVKDFLKFELSDEVQLHLEEHGYFPIRPVHRTINAKSGFFR